MLVGATARDLLLHHVYGLPVTRATYDVDFAILVDSWEQFATVKQLFLKVPGFIDKARDKQRLFYQQTSHSQGHHLTRACLNFFGLAHSVIYWVSPVAETTPVKLYSLVSRSSLYFRALPKQ